MVDQSIVAPILVISLRGPGNRGGTLKVPRFTMIEGRRFISGICQNGSGHWSDGQPMHIAIDEVATIVEYASESEHEAKCKWARRKSRGLFAKLRRR